MPSLFWENDTLFARAKHRLGRRDNRTLALPACRLFSEFRATRALLFFGEIRDYSLFRQTLT